MITYLDEKQDYLNLIDIGNQILESYDFGEDLEISSEKINEIFGFNKYYIDYSLDPITEASVDAGLNKIGVDSKGKSEIHKCAQDIAKTIKEQGITKESRKKIHNRISDLFKDLSDTITVQASAIIGKDADKHKSAKAMTLVAWCFIINTLANMVMAIFFGPQIAWVLTSVVIAPLVEESAKMISIKGSFDKEFYIVFNAAEFGSYIGKGIPAVISGDLGLSQLLRARTAAVGMHSVNTIIHKIFNSDKIREKLHLKNDEDSKDKASTASFIIGVLIHGTWNSLATFSQAFNNAIVGN